MGNYQILEYSSWHDQIQGSPGERSAVGPLTKLLLSKTPEQSQQNVHSGFYLGLFIDCARFCDVIILAELFA